MTIRSFRTAACFLSVGTVGSTITGVLEPRNNMKPQQARSRNNAIPFTGTSRAGWRPSAASYATITGEGVWRSVYHNPEGLPEDWMGSELRSYFLRAMNEHALIISKLQDVLAHLCCG